MTNQTPGPWHIHIDPETDEINHADPNHYMVHHDGTSVADDITVFADARLIAAAPYLLAALEGMVQVWARGWKVDQDIYIENARAAIEKAQKPV